MGKTQLKYADLEKGAVIEEAVDKRHLQGTDTTLGIMTSGVDMGGHKISSLIAPTDDADAANKSYVDSVGTGIIEQKLVLPIPYSLYAGAFSGNIFFRFVLSKNQDLSAPILNLDTGTAVADWKLWTGSEFQNLTSVGFPSTYDSLFYLWGSAERNTNYYGYWQAYQGAQNGDKVPIVVAL